MKVNKHTLFSALFLFIFLSAFSSGAYTSLKNSFTQFSHFSKTKQLKEDGTVLTSEDVVFEETENDSETSVSPSFTLLPGFLSFSSITFTSENNFSDFFCPEKTTDSLFLSIRVLRI